MANASETARPSAVQTERLIDWLLLTVAFIAVGAAFKTTEVLLVGDWDMWVDWKDREFWPLLYPVITIMFPAVVQGYLWRHFRIPMGATLSVLALHTVTWLTLLFGHVGWTNFPWTLVWTGTLIPGALMIDCVLLLTRNVFATAVAGAAVFAVIFYPANWPMLAPYRTVVEHQGQLVTVADLIGFTFTRTSMPEYLRIIERGTLRTFGENPAVVSSLFSASLTLLVYLGTFWVGWKASDIPWVESGHRKYMGLGK